MVGYGRGPGFGAVGDTGKLPSDTYARPFYIPAGSMPPDDSRMVCRGAGKPKELGFGVWGLDLYI